MVLLFLAVQNSSKSLRGRPCLQPLRVGYVAGRCVRSHEGVQLFEDALIGGWNRQMKSYDRRRLSGWVVSEPSEGCHEPTPMAAEAHHVCEKIGWREALGWDF